MIGFSQVVRRTGCASAFVSLTSVQMRRSRYDKQKCMTSPPDSSTSEFSDHKDRRRKSILRKGRSSGADRCRGQALTENRGKQDESMCCSWDRNCHCISCRPCSCREAIEGLQLHSRREL